MLKNSLGHEREMVYDGNGRMTKSIDQADVETSFEHDAMGRVTKTIFPSGSANVSTTEYNLLGQVTKQTGFGGNVTTFAYDGHERMTKVTDPVDDVSYGFDDWGRISTVTDSLGNVTTNGYNGADQYRVFTARDFEF